MKKTAIAMMRVLFLTTFISFMLIGTTQAYLDPAATSYIIQIVSGVVIASGVVVGVFWKKIRLFFRNIRMKMLENKLKKEAEKRGK